jgi:hypothetical protein
MIFSALTASRISKASCMAIALSIALAPISYAKKASFDMPACEKLNTKPLEAKFDNTQLTGEPDVADGPVITPSAPASTANKKALLEPVKLNDEKPAYSVGKDGKVKMKVSKNVKKQQEEETPDKMLSDAKKLNVTPLALLETASEQQQKMDAVAEAEKLQLTELWAATINRSPDIQFVIQRMQPHSDPNRATSTVIKVLGGALFSAAQMAPMMMPGGLGSMTGMAMYSGVGSGVNMLQNLTGSIDAKHQKKQQISQEQATMLYKMVRETADKLVANFRMYKKCRNQYEKAASDLEDLKVMVRTASENQPAPEIIKMEYFLRKQQRDVENITDDARVQRQALSDLAGPEAVAKLDDQVDEEIAMLKNMTGGDNAAAAQEMVAKEQPAAAPSEVEQQLNKLVPPQIAGNGKQKPL